MKEDITDFINMSYEKGIIEGYIEEESYKKALKLIEDLLPYSGEDMLYLQLYLGEIFYLQTYNEEAFNIWNQALLKIEAQMIGDEYWHALYRLYNLIGQEAEEEKKVSKVLLQEIRDILHV